MVTYMLGILLLANPYMFSLSEPKSKGLLFISVLSLSIIFPLIAVILMKFLGLINSLEMKGDKERVGPLIATGIFYLWLFVNIKNNDIIPEPFTIFVLGSTIALFIGFFISNFSNISLHTIGIGGLLMGLILFRYNFAYDQFVLIAGFLGTFLVSIDFVIICLLIIGGMVGTARLYLGAHDKDQVLGGYLVGFASQFFAYMILM